MTINIDSGKLNLMVERTVIYETCKPNQKSLTWHDFKKTSDYHIERCFPRCSRMTLHSGTAFHLYNKDEEHLAALFTNTLYNPI